jgi:hypothetical protein
VINPRGDQATMSRRENAPSLREVMMAMTRKVALFAAPMAELVTGRSP